MLYELLEAINITVNMQSFIRNIIIKDLTTESIQWMYGRVIRQTVTLRISNPGSEIVIPGDPSAWQGMKRERNRGFFEISRGLGRLLKFYTACKWGTCTNYVDK